MCGIAGACQLGTDAAPINSDDVLGMLAMIEHRGPDGFGVYCDGRVGLGSARLSIVDLEGGFQPISNEDGTVWIVYNGEVFNYLELRRGLEARGHVFSTHTDTEVIVHLYEEEGPNCLRHLNGQFAIALWDTRTRALLLARDRLGVRPLFYARHDGQLLFGSEVKALLAYPGMRAEIDREALEQIFVGWSVAAPRTIFAGVQQVPPGHFAVLKDGELKVKSWWSLDFDNSNHTVPDDVLIDQLEELLTDSVRIRMRADVPVGTYMSGGLDSSLTTALAQQFTNRLETFSMAFVDAPDYDEQSYQRMMTSRLDTRNHVAEIRQSDIGQIFPDVIWHAETPLMRTAPAPLFMLSKLVHEQGMKVVLTGEGADEVFVGYDIFSEMKVRRFWARQPESQLRPQLLRKLYPDVAALSGVQSSFLFAFFQQGLTNTSSPFYSHELRWSNTARARRFLAQSSTDSALSVMSSALKLPTNFGSWTSLQQAQYLEATTFLSPILLAPQGDRMGMGNSVEGRFPFLDYRVVEFASRLPDSLKLCGLTEKWILKQVGRKYLPEAICARKKTPYRAPIHHSFFAPTHGGSLDYVNELFSETALAESGLFKPEPAAQLARKARAVATNGGRLTEMEDIALVSILSAQLTHHHFIKNFRTRPVNASLVRKVAGTHIHVTA